MKALKCTFLVVFLMAPLSSFAGSLYCSGKVEKLAYHANNRVMIKLDSMSHPVFFCSPDGLWTVAGTHYKTDKETCKTLYSTFLSAKVSKTSITKILFDGDDVPASCDEWGAWKTANIRFFEF